MYKNNIYFPTPKKWREIYSSSPKTQLSYGSEETKNKSPLFNSWVFPFRNATVALPDRTIP